MDSMEKSIVAILPSLLSVDKETRRAAEAQLETLRGEPSFYMSSIQLVHPSFGLDPTSRLMVAISLKNAVVSRFRRDTTPFDRTFASAILSAIVAVAADEDRRVMRTLCECTAHFSSMYFPDGWPEMWQDVFSMIDANQLYVNLSESIPGVNVMSPATRGCLAVLAAVSDGMSKDDFVTVVNNQVLVPLAGIVGSRAAIDIRSDYPKEVKHALIEADRDASYAAAFFRSCLLCASDIAPSIGKSKKGGKAMTNSGSDGAAEAITSFFTTAAPAWSEALASVLESRFKYLQTCVLSNNNTNTTNRNDDAVDDEPIDCTLAISAIKAIGALVRAASGCHGLTLVNGNDNGAGAGAMLTRPLGVTFNVYMTAWSPYASLHANYAACAASAAGPADEAAGPDGELVGVPTLCLELISCVTKVLQSRMPSLVAAMKNSIRSVSSATVSLMALTDEQVESWSDDADALADAEDDLAQTRSVRAAAETLLEEMVSRYEEIALHAIGLAAGIALEKSEALRTGKIDPTNVDLTLGAANAGSSRYWWKAREAAYAAIGAVSHAWGMHLETVEALRAQGSPDARPVFDIITFLTEHCIADAVEHAAESPFLCSRAMQTVSTLADLIPGESITKLVANIASVCTRPEFLGGQGYVPLFMGSLRSFVNLNGTLGGRAAREVLAGAAGGIIEACTVLLPSVTESALGLALHALNVAIKSDKNAVLANNAARAGPLATALLESWKLNHADYLTVTDVNLVIYRLASVPELYTGVCSLVVPTIASMLRGHMEKNGSVDEAMVPPLVDLLSTILRATKGPHAPTVSQDTLNSCIAPLLSILLDPSRPTDDDVTLSQNACQCLTLVVVKNGDSLGQWAINDPALGSFIPGSDGAPAAGNVSGAQAIAAIATRYLSPTAGDTILIYAAPLAAMLFEHCSGSLAGHLPNLLSACVGRLTTAQLPMAVQGLLMVVARLALRNTAAFVSHLQAGNVNLPTADDPIALGGPTVIPGFDFVIRKWCKWQLRFDGTLAVKVSLLALATLVETHAAQLGAITVQAGRKRSENDTTNALDRIFEILATALGRLRGTGGDGANSKSGSAGIDSSDAAALAAAGFGGGRLNDDDDDDGNNEFGDDPAYNMSAATGAGRGQEFALLTEMFGGGGGADDGDDPDGYGFGLRDGWQDDDGGDFDDDDDDDDPDFEDPDDIGRAEDPVNQINLGDTLTEILSRWRAGNTQRFDTLAGGLPEKSRDRLAKAMKL